MTKDFRRYYVSKMMFLGAAMFLTSVGIASANPSSDMSDFSHLKKWEDADKKIKKAQRIRDYEGYVYELFEKRRSIYE